MNAEWVSGARAAWKCTVLVQARSHEAIMVAVDLDTARLPVRVSLGRFCAAADSDGAVDDVGARYTKLCSALLCQVGVLMPVALVLASLRDAMRDAR